LIGASNGWLPEENMMFKKLREIFATQKSLDQTRDAEDLAKVSDRAEVNKKAAKAATNYNPINYDKPAGDTEPGKAEW
jgi:hypothetical protein